MNISYVVLLISLAFCIFMFFYFKWYIKRRTSSSGLLPEYRAEIHRLIAEIDAVTDRDSLLVEERIKNLKSILDDTDRRISVYVKELEKSRTGEALYANLGRGIRAALKTESEFTLDKTQADPSISDIRSNIEVKPQITPVPVKQPDLQQVKNKPPSKRQIRSSIDLLLNENLPPEEIASRLDISIAEVDLAMNLRRKKN
jgi:hypothetical protein